MASLAIGFIVGLIAGLVARRKGKQKRETKMRIKVIDEFGRKSEVDNESADEYRLRQFGDHWVQAGELFCRLGVANPYGQFNETLRVRIMGIDNG